MKFRKNKKGFTLVELVVVIAILAILASVATVATVTILNNARKTPVTDTAASIKNQIQYWYASSAKNTNTCKWYNTNATYKEETLGGFINSAIAELDVNTTAVATPSKPSDDKIHIGCSSVTADLTANNYSVYVYSQYYYVKIDVTVKDKNYEKITISDPVKF